MKQKSAQERIKEWLRENPEWYASAHLQRLPWPNKDGTLASPRSVVRRLEELAEEGILEVEYRGKNAAYYRIKAEFKKPKYTYIDLPDGSKREVLIK